MSNSTKILLRVTGIMVASTVGVGIFALPFAFQAGGWFTGTLFLFAVTLFLVFAHSIHWDVLQKTGERQYLLGLVGRYCGKTAEFFGFFVIIGGLILALSAHLILGADFLGLLFPAIAPWTFVIFWILTSFPLFIRMKNLALSESLEAIFILSIIAFVFFKGLYGGVFPSILAVVPQGIFLPFSIILFALAGWSGLDSAFRYAHDAKIDLHKAKRAALWGTVLAAFCYALFVVGIWMVAEKITPDAISGLANLPRVETGVFLVLGLFALWASYIPISLEIKNSLSKDLKLSKLTGFSVALCVPALFALLGAKNFIGIVGLVGGVFLAFQYLLILVVGRRALPLVSSRRIVSDVVSVAFVLVAIYEIYHFVVG